MSAVLTELSESQIDAMSRDLRKRIALFRITSVLNALPATEPSPLDGGVSPGAAVAGNPLMESNA